MSAVNAIAVPSRRVGPWSLTPTRIVALFTTVVVGVVAVLWGAIAMQGPPGNPYGPPQGGGYGSAPENPYGPAPGPREAPPPELPNVPSPEPPAGSSGSSACDLSGCDPCGPCAEIGGSCAIDGLCEVLSLCDLLSACSVSSMRARAGLVALTFGELLLPIAVLVAWRKRERRREAAA